MHAALVLGSNISSRFPDHEPSCGPQRMDGYPMLRNGCRCECTCRQYLRTKKKGQSRVERWAAGATEENGGSRQPGSPQQWLPLPCSSTARRASKAETQNKSARRGAHCPKARLTPPSGCSPPPLAAPPPAGSTRCRCHCQLCCSAAAPGRWRPRPAPCRLAGRGPPGQPRGCRTRSASGRSGSRCPAPAAQGWECCFRVYITGEKTMISRWSVI